MDPCVNSITNAEKMLDDMLALQSGSSTEFVGKKWVYWFSMIGA